MTDAKTVGQKWAERLQQAAMVEGEEAVAHTVKVLMAHIEADEKKATPSMSIRVPVGELKWDLLCKGDWKPTATLSAVIDIMKKRHVNVAIIGCTCAHFDTDPCSCSAKALELKVAM